MPTNKKIIYGIIIGIFLIIIISLINNLIISGYYQRNPINPDHSQALKGICGPKGAGKTYNPTYCNESCNSDIDCQYTCGCGAINKKEVCHDEGIIYDCVDNYVGCQEGKCVALGEKIPKPGVTISTDKTEYAVGEIIKITVNNNSDKSVLYKPGNLFWQIERWENNKWDDSYSYFQVHSGKEGDPCSLAQYEQAEPTPLNSQSEIAVEWDQLICPFEYYPGFTQPTKLIYIGSGKYRLIFTYGYEIADNDPFQINDRKTIYSNEFTISDKTNNKETPLYKKESSWGPCPNPEGGCFLNTYFYNSGRLVLESKNTTEKQLSPKAVNEIIEKIKTSGIMNKNCEATAVVDYWVTYTFNLDGKTKTIIFPGCEEELKEIDNLIESFIEN